MNGDIDVSNFSGILGNRINSMLTERGLTLNQCVQNSVLTEWFIDLRIGGEILIQQTF